MAAYTLTEMLAEVGKQLNDTTNLIWSTSLLTRAVRPSLQEINRYFPRLIVGTISATAATRQYSLSALPGLLTPVSIWYPYVATDHPPRVINWMMITDDFLYLNVDDAPVAGATIRVFYLASHTVNGLDAATASTLSTILEELVIEGACAHAVAIKAADTIGEINTDAETPRQWREEADRRLKFWNGRLWRLRRDPSDARAGQWPVDKWDTYR